MLLTKLQRQALARVYHRSYTPMRDGVHFKNYYTFRRTVFLGPGCIMVPFAGMLLGIEPDGYTHS